jgi:hypothetical protein
MAVDIAPKNKAGTNTQRRGQRSHSQPAGPFDNSRTHRFADNITPTAANVIAASAVCVGSTVYIDVSPSNDNAVPSPTTPITSQPFTALSSLNIIFIHLSFSPQPLCSPASSLPCFTDY